MNPICSRVKEIRKSYALTQVDFSKRLGVTNAHISAIEKDKTIPSPALIKLISKEFRINENWLITGLGELEEENEENFIEKQLLEAVERINSARTLENLPVRSRVVQIEALFSKILEINETNDTKKIQYLEILHKLFFHLNSFLEFSKDSALNNQLHLFPYPDNILENLKGDIADLESYFLEMNKNSK